MILHGMVDTAGQASYSVEGLKKNNCPAELVVWSDNKFGYSKGLCINKKGQSRYRRILNELAFGIHAFFRYDVFHFHNATSLFPHGLDLFFLRYFHKNFIMEFHGSELRWSSYRKKPPYWSGELTEFTKGQQVILNRIFKYTDKVILHDDELRKHLPASIKKIYIVPLRIDLDNFLPQYPDGKVKRPIIVHAPSDRAIKGSCYIIQAIESLKQKYDFEFILVQNKNQAEALEIYKKADIIIDQLFIGTYGVFALEALALGKPVISYISEDMIKTFPDSLPIVNANTNNLLNKIEMLIINPELRKKLGVQGRQYVEMYHDAKTIAKLQKQIYFCEIKPLPAKESFEYVKELRSI